VKEREPLPSREQIQAITDRAALEALRDEVDRRVAKIETDLDFLDGDDDWERRARNALALHRYTSGIINRQLRRISPESPFRALAGVKTVTRERTDCHELSWELLDADPIDVEALTSPAAVAAALHRLNQQVAALEADRADEIARFEPAARDEGWLAEANAALQNAKQARHRLVLREGEFRRAEKQALQRERASDRAQVFIDCARETLPQDVYLMLWDRVDRTIAARALEREDAA
jgi:hypothetical protein